MVSCNPGAGGTEGLEKLVARLHELDCAVIHYEHPFAVDPDGAGYMPSSDPMQHTEHWNSVTHHSVCVDNEAVRSLWSNRILPDIAALAPDGIQFDQGSLQQTVCDLPDHYHGLDALSRLTSHIHAIVDLSKETREKIGFIFSESTCDLLTRYMDMRQNALNRKPLFGGEHLPVMQHFTFPQYIYGYDNYRLVNGGAKEDYVLKCGVYGGILTVHNSYYDDKLQSYKKYTEFRKKIREANAPGYPSGFRHTVGLTVPEGVTASAFVDKNGVTITYCTSEEEITGVISVDLAELGVKGGGTKEIELSMSPYTIDFTVLK